LGEAVARGSSSADAPWALVSMGSASSPDASTPSTFIGSAVSGLGAVAAEGAGGAGGASTGGSRRGAVGLGDIPSRNL